MAAKTILKYGGLLMSGVLTIALFLDLFSKYGDFYSWVMAGAALVLFEGGALLWNHLIDQAKGSQRIISKVGMWICVILSLASSCLQIIMTTSLIKAQFNTGEAALWTIALALAVNVVGVIAFELLDPDRFSWNKDQDHAAEIEQKKHDFVKKIMHTAFAKANTRVDEISGDISDAYAEHIKQEVFNYMVARTPVEVKVKKKTPTTPTKDDDNDEEEEKPKLKQPPKQIIDEKSSNKLRPVLGRGSRNGQPVDEAIVSPDGHLDSDN